MPFPAILIVEDDPLIRKLLSLRFAREPLQVDTAGDGVSALERLRSATYAVMLLDLMMARMSGFQVIEALQRFERRPLVFVMTAYDDSVTRTLDGRIVHAVWRKPFDLERLVGVARDCMAGWQAGQPLTANAAAVPADLRTA